MALAGFILGLPLATYGLSDFRYMMVGCGFLAWPALLGLTLLSGRKIEMSDPINLFMMAVLTGMTLASFPLAFSDSSRVNYMMADRNRESFAMGSVFALIALVVIGIGYTGCSRRIRIERFVPSGSRLSERGMQIGMAIGTVLAMLAAVSFIQSTGGFAAIGKKRALEIASGGDVVFAAAGYSRMLASLSGAIMLVLFSYYLQNYRRIPTLIRIELVLLFGATCMLPFISSARGQVVSLLIALVMVYSCHRTIPRRTLIICALTVVLGFNAMSAMRSASQGEGAHERKNPLISIGESGNGYSTVAFTHIILGVPERMDYQLGTTLFTWVTAPIPRSVWPGKPDVSLGKRVLGEIIQQNVLRTGRPPGFVGEGIMNFGWIGFSLFSLLLGYLMRLTANSFLPVVTSSPFLPPLYYYTASNVAQLANSNLSQALVRYGTDVVILIISYILLQHLLARRSGQMRIRSHPAH